MISPVTHKAEWDFMWNALKAHFRAKDFAEYNASFGEAWQYMGTSIKESKWTHFFRHRAHPSTNERATWSVWATDDFHSMHSRPEPRPTVRPYERPVPRFNPSDCSGVFDGITVTSDADPGL
jgi:hypothetical protein